jgi:glucokinase
LRVPAVFVDIAFVLVNFYCQLHISHAKTSASVRLLGIDLGGTNIKLAVVEEERVAVTDQAPTRSDDGGPDEVLERMAALARRHLPADAVGVSLPGLFDDDGRALLLPNLHGDWAGRPIAAPLTRALGVPVALVNDGHAFALAEAELGGGRGKRDVMCVVCGTGVGGGLVVGGQLHLGLLGRAGELGHHTVAEDGPLCPCGNRGCLELYAGARAIATAAGHASFDHAIAAARAGDAAAVRAIARAGTLIGIAVANVLIFLSPEAVIVGGGVAMAAELLLDPLRAEVERRARVAPLELIDIAPAALGPIAGAVGAALFARGN